jgi:Domain of unknown function (DUF3854)/Bacterial regulatory protein, arsR family
MSQQSQYNPFVDSQYELLPHHRDQLHASGLTDQTIQIAGFWSETDPAHMARCLNWGMPNPSLMPALAIVDNSCGFCFRPDNPRTSRGKTVKYECPRREEPRLYFAPQSVAPGGWWRSDVLILTEGIKKALCIAQEGYEAISAQGVYLWHDVRHKEHTGVWQLVRQFPRNTLLQHSQVAYGWGTTNAQLVNVERHRLVFIAFDGGDTSENPDVIYAEIHLVKMLRDYGADVRLIRIPHTPGGPKVGIDDYLARFPIGEQRAAAMKGLLDTAIMPTYPPGASEVVQRTRAALNAMPPWTGKQGTHKLVLERLLDLAVVQDRLDLLVTARRPLGLNLGRETISAALDALVPAGWIRPRPDLDRRGSTCWEITDLGPSWSTVQPAPAGLSPEQRRLLDHDCWSRRPAQRDIYRLLLEAPRTVVDIQAATGRSRSVVFGHLQKLHDAGLARQIEGHWHAITDIFALQAAARARGTAGTVERRTARNERERRTYRSRYR